MHRKRLRFEDDFRVAFDNGRAQAAEMTLAVGDREGGPDNRHLGADQWLFVVSGAGRARVGGRTVRLSEGVLLLIEKGERHEIRNTGDEPLRTLNLYVPPDYDARGEPLPRGRSKPA